MDRVTAQSRAGVETSSLSLFGLKVFMDAHNTVTVEEGDRYPLRPPIFEATPPGYFLARALGPATVASPYFIP